MLLKNSIGFELGNDNTILQLKQYGKWYFWLIVFVMGPLFETIFFQIFIIKLVGFYTDKKNIAVFLSALVFSLNHIYSLPYMIYTFFGGLLFANLYFEAKENKLNAFKVIFITHVMINISISIFHRLFFE